MLKVLGCITEQHDLRLVFMAALLCVFACTTAFSMLARARAAQGHVQTIWLAAAGFVAGCGIWATHFVAMLAYQTGMPTSYDGPLTVLSALIAVVLCGVGYKIAIGRVGPIFGGSVAGVAIGAMHYIGMAAVRMPADVVWNYQYVAASIIIGVGLTAAAMCVVIRNRSWRGVLGGAGIFTIAIVIMHFTGMTAVTFRPDPLMVVSNALVAPSTLAISVAAVAFLIIALGLVGSLVDNHLERRAVGEADRLRRHVAELEATKVELVEQQQQLRLLAKIATASNQTTSISEVLQLAVTLICEFTGWQVGHIYSTFGAEDNIELRSSLIWHAENLAHIEGFQRASQEMAFRPGVGLPGRVLATGKPLWVLDVTKDDNFPRRPSALKCGLKGASAFPVYCAGEVIAVLELFSTNARQPNGPLLELMTQMGLQLGLIIERQRAKDALLATNTALTDVQQAVRNLLDNADQGFLTVTWDLRVEEQSSAACGAILGEVPGGKLITDLLCKNISHSAKSTMDATLKSVFRERTDYIRDLKIALLPTTFDLDGKSVTTSYKFLCDSGRLMLILTDVTQTTLLTVAVERERQRLEMIVLATTEGDAFVALVNDYQKFVADELPLLLALIDTPGIRSDLQRRVHTYKGLLAQFSFHRSPQRLHELETSLSAEGSGIDQATRDALEPDSLITELKRDLDSVTDVLGSDFTSSGRRVFLPQHQLQTMKQDAKDVLIGAEARNMSPQLRRLLKSVSGLGSLDVKSALSLHGRGATALAARLDKRLGPIQFCGDDAGLPSDVYGEFFRSLVHVFRNAVDHGLETPEERVLRGKPAEGTISCHVRNDRAGLEILIKDDGRGVNRSALENKLLAAGLEPLRVWSLSLEDLVFCEGLSSRDTASEVSGRGIGLAAVKTELDCLGGSVAVDTDPGAGTRFRFRLPVKLNASALSTAA